MAENMVRITAQLHGVQEVQKALKQFQPTLQKKLQRKATRKAGKPVLDTARARVPVKTGKLRKNLKLRAAKRKRSSTVVGVSVQTPTRDVLGISQSDPYYYPTVLEYGSSLRNIRARPYLRPALDENREKVRGIYASELKGLITETAAQLRAGAITEKGVKVKS